MHQDGADSQLQSSGARRTAQGTSSQRCAASAGAFAPGRGNGGSPRELAERTKDGLTVRLLWDGAEKVYLQLWDSKTESVDEFPVPKQSALDAFEHPFRYEPATAAVLT
jgi:hypothetical protein